MRIVGFPMPWLIISNESKVLFSLKTFGNFYFGNFSCENLDIFQDIYAAFFREKIKWFSYSAQTAL